MNNYVVLVEFEIQPDNHQQFLDRVLQQARDSVALEKGCHLFDVCENADDGTVLLYEIYSDKAAFDLHLASDHFQSFDAEVSPWIIHKSVRILELKESVQ